MKGDITNPEVMLAHQGDRVLVLREGKPDTALTLVRVMDIGKQRMRLCNREDKTHKPDWAVDNEIWAAIEPARPNKLGCKWELLIE